METPGASKAEIGSRIKLVRGGMSQDKFAKEVGSHRNSIARYENGLGSPDAELVAAVCSRFNIRTNWLLTGEGQMRRDKVAAQDDLDSFLHYIDKRLAELEKEDPDVRPWFRYEFKKRFPELIEREAAETETDNRQQEQKLA